MGAGRGERGGSVVDGVPGNVGSIFRSGSEGLNPEFKGRLNKRLIDQSHNCRIQQNLRVIVVPSFTSVGSLSAITELNLTN